MPLSDEILTFLKGAITEATEAKVNLTPNMHHLVRDSLLDATIVGVNHELSHGQPDRLLLRLDSGLTAVLEGAPLNLRFEE